jgi:hypothetical protein
MTPYVEVLHTDVESARKIITGKSYYTINAQLRSLMGSTDTLWRWIFAEGRDIGPVAKRMADDFMTYGVPFIEQFRTLEAIISGLEVLETGPHTIMRHSLAISYGLVGRRKEAEEVLRVEAEAARSQTRGDARARLQRYAELFKLDLTV